MLQELSRLLRKKKPQWVVGMDAPEVVLEVVLEIVLVAARAVV